MLGRLKKKLVNWLLKDVEVQKLVVDKLVTKLLQVGLGTTKVTGNGIIFPGLTSDPSLVAGLLWFRSDTAQVKFSPDGSAVKTVFPADWGDITNKPSAYPPESHTHSRSDITDFWDSPFWDNIPDKPSTFPPEAHASTHLPGGSDQLFDQSLNTSDSPTFAGITINGNASISGNATVSGVLSVGDIKLKNNWTIREYYDKLLFINPDGIPILVLKPDGELVRVECVRE